MRTKLKLINGSRTRFFGRFEKFGTKPRYKPKKVISPLGYCEWLDYDQTILLTNIQDNQNGDLLCDHLWLNYTKGFEKLGELTKGDLIFFDARVTEYQKGYINNREYPNQLETDYRLSNPTKIEVSR